MQKGRWIVKSAERESSSPKRNDKKRKREEVKRETGRRETKREEESWDDRGAKKGQKRDKSGQETKKNEG